MRVQSLTRARASGGDDGAAMVEFVVLAVVLVVPLVYLVIAIFDVQRATFATTAAVREAARVFVVSSSTGEAEQRAHQAVELALRDQGVPSEWATVDIQCLADPCLTPGAKVVVQVATVVPLPLVPWLGDRPTAAVPVRASHTQTVDMYVAVGP